MAFANTWEKMDYPDVIAQQSRDFPACYSKVILQGGPSTLVPPTRYPASYLAATRQEKSPSNPHHLTRQQFLSLTPQQQADAAVRDPGLLLQLPFPTFARVFSTCFGGNWRYFFDGLYPLHLHLWLQLFAP